MKKITLLAAMLLCFFVVKAQEEQVIFEDDFESYEDFITEGIGDYTLIDGDLSPTYSFQGIVFPNAGEAFAYMVFNTNETSPPLDPTPGDSDWSANSGSKSLAAFASVEGPNDDWLITPAMTLGESGNVLSFFAKAADADYSAEYFNVGVSTDGTDPEDFTMIATDELPGAAVWEEVSYDLDDYAGEEVYIAIQHVGNDQFGFLIDDILVTAGELSVDQEVFLGFNQYVANDQLHISANNQIQSVELFNMLGQNVISEKIETTSGEVSLASLTSGIYIAKVMIEGKQKSFKITVK